MKNGANPNCITNENKTTLPLAVGRGNMEMIKCLLNVDKQFKHSFDWVKLDQHFI